MVCPGCGGKLLPESAAGFDYSYQCGLCGGFWVANWVVNNLANGKELKVAPKNGPDLAVTGKNLCPTDGVALVNPPREAMPEDVTAEKCNQCGWWWYPGDEIFKFTKAIMAKHEYVKLWRKNDWMAYAWPALVLMLMMAGLGGSVILVRNRQKAAIEATESVRELSLMNVEKGLIEVRFKTTYEVREIEYKEINSLRFLPVEVKYKDGYYTARLSDLNRGVYIVRILGKESRVEVK